MNLRHEELKTLNVWIITLTVLDLLKKFLMN